MKHQKIFVLLIGILTFVISNVTFAQLVEKEINLEIKNKSDEHGITVSAIPDCQNVSGSCSCFQLGQRSCSFQKPTQTIEFTIGSESKGGLFYKGQVSSSYVGSFWSSVIITKYNDTQTTYCHLYLRQYYNSPSIVIEQCDGDCSCSGNKITVTPSS